MYQTDTPVNHIVVRIAYTCYVSRAPRAPIVQTLVPLHELHNNTP